MRRLGALVLFISLVGLGCGDDGEGPPGPGTVTDAPDAKDQSGTRLKRRISVTPDGFIDQTGWFDSLLHVNCGFLPLADGSTRCVPTGADAVVHFRDAACTDPILWSSSGLAATGYVQTTDLCKVSFWRDPVATTGPATVYAHGIAGNCYALSPSTGVSYTATPVAPSEFVGEILTLEGPGTDLKARIRTTEDGARQYLYMYSTTLDTPCREDLMADGKIHCTPRGADGSDSSPATYADAACTQLVRTFLTCQPYQTAPKFRLSVADSERTCGPTAHDYAPMTVYTGPLYSMPATTCMPVTSSPEFTYLLVGDKLPPSSFVAETTRAIGEPATRVRRSYSLYEDGSIGPHELAWDTKLAVSTDLRDDQNSVERWQPADYLDLTPAFADDMCTQPLADSSGNVCPAERRPAWARLTNGMFFRVTGEYSMPTAYTNGTASCTQVPVVDPPLFTVDPTVVTDWEPTTLTVEP